MLSRNQWSRLGLGNSLVIGDFQFDGLASIIFTSFSNATRKLGKKRKKSIFSAPPISILGIFHIN
jgi:hypothetical protein